MRDGLWVSAMARVAARGIRGDNSATPPMPLSSHRAEISVGLFLLIGIAVAGGLILRFSQSRLLPSGGYPITVEVKDATGIRAGVPVRLGGVDIWRVSGDPSLGDDFVILSIPLEIFPGNRIPAGSVVKVGTSGLMGDSYVRILPPERPTGEFLPEGHRLVAAPASSFADLADEADETLDGVAAAALQMRLTADQIGSLAGKLEGSLLTDENLANLGTLLAEMKTAATNLRAASEQAAPLLAETREAVGGLGEAAATAKTSFGGIDQGVSELTATLAATRPVLEEFDGTLDDLRKTLAEAKALLDEFEHGNGLAAAFLKDPVLKRDFANFISKLSRHGILLYPREGGLIRGDSSDSPRSGTPAPRIGPRRQP